MKRLPTPSSKVSVAGGPTQTRLFRPILYSSQPAEIAIADADTTAQREAIRRRVAASGVPLLR